MILSRPYNARYDDRFNNFACFIGMVFVPLIKEMKLMMKNIWSKSHLVLCEYVLPIVTFFLFEVISFVSYGISYCLFMTKYRYG